MSRRVLCYEFRPGDPPREIQLWDVGDNPTDFGVHRWTDRSASRVMKAYAQRGNPLQIDVEHNAAEPPEDPSEPPVTGGYARLEIRAGAPWLVFDWSAYAVEQIRTRQRLFLSPDYHVDSATGEITGLTRVSLVSSPGTHHARMLASAKRVRAGSPNMDLALILAALRAALAAEDPQVAKDNINALIAQIEGAASSGSEAPAEAAGETPVQAEEPADPPTPPAPTDDAEKDKEPVQASAKRPASAPTPAEMDMAQRLAKVEVELAKRDAEQRYQASAARVPASLRDFARKLASSDPEQFATFIAGLPEAPKRSIQAAAAPPQGAPQTHDERVKAARAAMSAEDLAEMDRVFGNGPRPTSSIEVLPNGRLRATHILSRKAGS